MAITNNITNDSRVNWIISWTHQVLLIKVLMLVVHLQNGHRATDLFSILTAFSATQEGRKKIKKAKSWTTEPISKFEFVGGETIIETAEAKHDYDLLRRIKGYDLYACEAQFHPSCRKRYSTDPELWHSVVAGKKLEQQNLETLHKAAYEQVCSLVHEMLIEKRGIRKMTYLLKKYTDYLHKTGHCNPNYRSARLRPKLQKTQVHSALFL